MRDTLDPASLHPVNLNQARELRQFVLSHPRLMVLTGAGISTRSGIPAYRDQAGRWLGSDPIQHGEFVADHGKRQRYWARSAAGWPAVAKAQPNLAHRALAGMEEAGRIEILVTQNVDRLHQRAGHRRVVDLHGRLDRVRCLDCGQFEDRNALQRRLLATNPGLGVNDAALAPDGDAWVVDQQIATLAVPACLHCEGVMMPDVVFFGGAVPIERVRQSQQALEKVDALLVVGSSLTVYSGFRFCRIASELGKPIVVINRGATRADSMLALKVESDCAAALSTLADALF